MDQKINLFIQLRSRYYRDSLAALLATLPEVKLFNSDNILQNPPETDDQAVINILLYECSQVPDEHSVMIFRARQTWPRLKIILLVESTRSVRDNPFVDVDLILPVNTTARELLQSVNRLAGREYAVRDFAQYSPLNLTC